MTWIARSPRVTAVSEFTAFGAPTTATTLTMSSVYDALWLSVGSAAVNLAGAAALALYALLKAFSRR